VPPELLRERREAPRDKPPRRVASRENAIAYTVGARRAFGLLVLAIVVVTVVVQVLPRVVEHAPDRNIPGFE
jgi:t-SNARE complex subunit (syntaxin)